MKLRISILIRAFAASISASAQLSTPPVISSDMVLQQGREVPVWGKAAPGERVTVTFGKQKVKAKAAADSTWSVSLEPMEADATPRTLTIKGKEQTLEYTNVVVGEVWVAAGQSNMQYPMRRGKVFAAPACGVDSAQVELRQPANPMIRVYVSARRGQKPWAVAGPESLPEVSAVGYYFARSLQRSLGVPVGIVTTALGGTKIEAWTPREAYERSAAFAGELERSGRIGGLGPGQWYKTYVAPIVPLAVRGFVWYQGENNVSGYMKYEALFKGLINNWRDIWNDDFPFYFVQLAGHLQAVEVQPGSQWAALRWEQQKALELDNTGMATAVDIGDVDDLHPKNKQEVGRRLALVALKNTYGFTDIIDKAPELKSYSFTNRKAVLTFSAPLTLKEVAQPRGFIMQTSTGSFVKGRCTLENDSTISVSGTFTGAPISVRYNWADFPNGNLYGENDLPVLPFRTDQMDGVINDIETVKTDSNDKTVDVVTTDGVVVRRNADHSSATSGLPEGVYIVGSEKVLVK